MPVIEPVNAPESPLGGWWEVRTDRTVGYFPEDPNEVMNDIWQGLSVEDRCDALILAFPDGFMKVLREDGTYQNVKNPPR